ncbi:MAG TPA: hypothetical protein VK604_11075 [Bryobacteraceae bacterium]|nr:hypothetical protein [Bryobacteraceae bacterium]
MKSVTSLMELAIPLLMLLLPHSGAARQRTADEPGPQSQSFHRNYQANAYISFLSLPLFNRSNVGFGFASSAEQMKGETRTITLRFLSGSTPERAAGLNRFGFMEENVEQKDRAVVGANYFGLITSNGEESFSDAKVALQSEHRDQVPFVGAQAVIEPGRARYSIRHMLLPSHYRGSNAELLLERLRAEFSQPGSPDEQKTEVFHGQALGTFLYSLQQAMQTEGAAYEGRFIYNGKIFRLHAGKRRDMKTGEELRKKGITQAAVAITALNGNIVNEKTKESTTFRLWFESGAANFLPLRFEFKPKGYLKLVFDAEPPAPLAAMQQALSQNLNRPGVNRETRP